MIIVFGSLNVDMITQVVSLPKPGETVLCPSYETQPGGKGCNQAVAAAKAGGQVRMVGRTGQDGNGDYLKQILTDAGVDISGVTSCPDPTGTAFIFVDEKAENSIVVASGANAKVVGDDLTNNHLEGGSILLLQMEIPAQANWAAITKAKEKNMRVVLNLAPAGKITREALQLVDDLIVNEIELGTIAAQLSIDHLNLTDQMTKIAHDFQVNCITTLGSKGVKLAQKSNANITDIAALNITPVDTTGAGDAFTGNYVAALSRGQDTVQACQEAVIASGLACLKIGAQAALPNRQDVLDYLSTPIRSAGFVKEYRNG